MIKFLMLIKKNLLISIFVGMAVGLVVGYNFDVDYFSYFILPLTFMLVYPMMVTLNFHKLVEKSNVKLQLTTQIINFLIFPFIAVVLGLIFYADNPNLKLGLLLIALLPTSGMTISWTVMAKGNLNEAIRMVIIGLLLGGIAAPFYITQILGSEVDVPIMTMVTQVMIIVFAPLIIGYLTQKGLIKKFGAQKFHNGIKQKFPLISTLGIVVMISVAMALKANALINNPSILLDIMLPLIIIYILFILISVFTARTFFNRADGIALVNGTLIRNLSLSLALALSVFPDQGTTGIMISVAYVLQVQIAAWSVKLTKYIFKPEQTKV